MDALEILIRDSLREHAADAPTVVPPVAARRRWPYALVAAAVVAALAVGLAVWHGPAGQPTATRPPAGHSTATVPTRPPAAAGYRVIGYRSVTLEVPDDVPVYTTPCVLPTRYVLAADPNIVYDCVAADADNPTFVVQITPSGAAPHPGEAPPNTAERSYDGLGVWVSVTTADPAVRDHVLDSVRAGADPLGCPQTREPVHNPDSTSLVPGSPESAVRCVYSTDGGLLAGYPVAAGALADLVTAIDALPRTSSVGFHGQPFETDLLRFTYPGDAIVTLTVGMNDPTEYSDGDHVGYDHANTVTDQLRDAAGP